MTGFWFEEPCGKGKRAVGFTCPSCGEHIGPRVGEVIQLGRVKLDTSTRVVWIDGQYFDISNRNRRGQFGVGRGKEITILIEMMRAPGQLFTAERLMDITDTWDAGPHIISVFMSRLRRAFGDHLEFRNYRGSVGGGGRDGAFSLHVREEIVA